MKAILNKPILNVLILLILVCIIFNKEVRANEWKDRGVHLSEREFSYVAYGVQRSTKINNLQKTCWLGEIYFQYYIFYHVLDLNAWGQGLSHMATSLNDLHAGGSHEKSTFSFYYKTEDPEDFLKKAEIKFKELGYNQGIVYSLNFDLRTEAQKLSQVYLNIIRMILGKIQEGTTKLGREDPRLLQEIVLLKELSLWKAYRNENAIIEIIKLNFINPNKNFEGPGSFVLLKREKLMNSIIESCSPSLRPYIFYKLADNYNKYYENYPNLRFKIIDSQEYISKVSNTELKENWMRRDQFEIRKKAQKYQMIRMVQKKLLELGYYQGKIDGIEGKKTKGVLSRYQMDKGLKKTARIDEMTLKSLGLYKELSK